MSDHLKSRIDLARSIIGGDDLFQEYIDYLCGKLENIARDMRPDMIVPALFIVTSNAAKYKLIMIDLGDVEKTEQIYQDAPNLGKGVYEMGYLMVAAYFISEVWALDIELEPGESIPSNLDIEQHPNRKEMVSVCGLTIDGRVFIAHYPFHREEEGAIVLDGREDVPVSFIPNSFMGADSILMRFMNGYAKARLNITSEAEREIKRKDAIDGYIRRNPGNRNKSVH